MTGRAYLIGSPDIQARGWRRWSDSRMGLDLLGQTRTSVDKTEMVVAIRLWRMTPDEYTSEIGKDRVHVGLGGHHRWLRSDG
jgi:hypothetical protein